MLVLVFLLLGFADCSLTLFASRPDLSGICNLNSVQVCQFHLTTSLSSETVRAVEVISELREPTSARFYQSSSSGHVSPLAWVKTEVPGSACDSFVTFGLTERRDESDCSAVSPDLLFNELNFTGSFYCSQPGSMQPVVRSGSSLLVAQVSLLKNFDEPSVYVKLRVYGRGASSVDVESICDRTTPASVVLPGPVTMTIPPAATTTTSLPLTSGVVSSSPPSSFSAPISTPASTTSRGSGTSNVVATGAGVFETTFPATAAGESQAWIAGVVIGVLVGVVLLLAVVAVLFRKRNHARSSVISVGQDTPMTVMGSSSLLDRADDGVEQYVDFL